jgi:hypothetical protein
MQLEGVPSWQFAEGGTQLATAALYVRDSLRLPVPSAADVPPPLNGPVPARDDLVIDRQLAADQWLTWWRQIIEYEVTHRRRHDHIRDPRMRMRTTLRELARVSDPPDFQALSDRPELQAAAVATHPAAIRWENGEAQLRPPGSSRIGWAMLKEIAEAVAFDRRVSSEAIYGTALVLDLDGSWWHRPAPGLALCSAAALADSHTAQVIVRDIFESNLES